MDITQKSKQIHEQLKHKMEEKGMDSAAIESELKLIDETVFETVIQEKISSLDDETYKKFQNLIDSASSHEELATLIPFPKEELQERLVYKLAEYLLID